MNRSTFRFTAGSLVCLLLQTGGVDCSAADSPLPRLDDAAVRSRVESLLVQMTPEEKAGQLSQFFSFSTGEKLSKSLAESLRKGEIGSLLFVTNPVLHNAIQKEAVEGSRLKIPVLFGYDVVHGFRTIFPVPLGMAATWDPEIVKESQAIAAAEARAVGLHWAFAPMIDVSRDPRWGRIVEGAGEDPFLASVMAAAQVRGFQGPYLGSPEHVISGPKHFAGYGASVGGRDYDEVNISDSELWNVYLPPFEAAIKAGAGNVMTAYMGLNGVPVSGNRWLLTDVLREKLGFQGLVVSDANAVKSLVAHRFAEDNPDAAVRALNAGVDMEMSLNANAYSTLPAALKDGRIEIKTLDAAVARVLEAKLRMGLFENPYVDVSRTEQVLKDPAHRVKARIAAERSVVLLRNEGGVLPLSSESLKSLAVIGPLADAPREILGPWSFRHEIAESVSVLNGIRARLGEAVRVDFAWGPVLPKRLQPSPFGIITGKSDAPIEDLDTATAIDRAVAIARNADAVVMVVGERQEMIGELASRATLDLPGAQEQLIDAVVATGKPVVLVLMSARPLDLRRIVTKVPAILHIWYPGTQGGTAVANVLFGDVSPGGKLPFSWVRSIGQVPTFYAHLTSQSPKDAHKRYWDEVGGPLFPFGHGLSYSTFTYDNLRLDRPEITRGETLRVSVDLKNTGGRRADEVAQIYIHQRYGSSARPVRELKGFQRITLDPGETRQVTFTLGPDELKYWSTAERDWVLEASTFDLWVGGDSTAALQTTFEVR